MAKRFVSQLRYSWCGRRCDFWHMREVLAQCRELRSTNPSSTGMNFSDYPTNQASGITSEQGTASCAVGDDRKLTTYAFVSWRVARHPDTSRLVSA